MCICYNFVMNSELNQLNKARETLEIYLTGGGGV